MADTIRDNKVVSLAYVLTVDGEEVDRADADDPLDYLHGADNIIPGLEAALAGKTVGDKFTITIPAADAYGEYDEEELDEVPLDEMPNIHELEQGALVEVEDEEGYVYLAYVREITSSAVVLDFNPPLAGKDVTYDVEVLAIRDADEEELEHGHPHSLIEFDEYEDEEE
jgi:FKBP-type peptidyl-prolyl cis-trans isomerase SlyD